MLLLAARHLGGSAKQDELLQSVPYKQPLVLRQSNLIPRNHSSDGGTFSPYYRPVKVEGNEYPSTTHKSLKTNRLSLLADEPGIAKTGSCLKYKRTIRKDSQEIVSLKYNSEREKYHFE